MNGNKKGLRSKKLGQNKKESSKLLQKNFLKYK